MTKDDSNGPARTTLSTRDAAAAASERCQPAVKAISALKEGTTSAIDQAATTSADNGRPLIELLAASRLYREYEKAFNEALGVPLTLRSVESWQLPYHGKRLENPFCAF